MNLLGIVQNSLPGSLSSGARLLVALSGGADSVCLLLALRELGFEVEALHCNFELRGIESDGDEAFCRRLCRAQGISLTVKHFRTKSYAQRHAVSIEMAARRLRYEWFAEMAELRGAEAVCVAHHRDDNIETFFLNLVRGTGIHGITGMSFSQPLPQASRGLLLRPLLRLSRMDIEAWLEERGQTWCTDSTNLRPEAAQRNFVRLRLLPLLEEMNPRVRETLDENIQRFVEAESLFDVAVNDALQRILVSEECLDIARLKSEKAPRSILQEWLHPLGFNSIQINEIFEGLDGDSGRVWQSPSHRLLRDRGRLLLQSSLSAATEKAEQIQVAPDGKVLPLDGLFIASSDVRLLIRRQAVDAASFVIPRDRQTACFDLEKLDLPLIIRPAREGDRMQPFGMDGTRLVSDIMTDRKLSLFEKERQLVVLSGERIVWLVGQRVAAGYEVDEATRHAMTLTLL